MSKESQNPELLHKKYRDLNTSPEVGRASRRAKRRTGKELPPQQPGPRIQSYLDRLKAIVDPAELDIPSTSEHQDFDRRERNLEMLKRALHKQFVIQPKDIPKAYFESIRKRHEEEGRDKLRIQVRDNRHSGGGKEVYSGRCPDEMAVPAAVLLAGLCGKMAGTKGRNYWGLWFTCESTGPIETFL